MGSRLTEIFLLLFCEKNSNGTKKLRLKGKDLDQRIGTRLIASDMEYICEFLEKHPEVNEINFSYNEFGDDGMEILCDRVLSRKNNLEHLNLAHCDLTDSGTKTMYFCSQGGFIKLRTLRLFGNKIGSMGAYAVTLMVKFCPTIEYLDLGDTDQTPNSIDNLFYELHKIDIKILNISRVIPYVHSSHYDSQFLAGSLHELLTLNNTLVELHAQKCDLTSHDMETIREALYYNKTLLFFDVGYNNICDMGVELLAVWLKTRPQLRALNIAGNALTIAAARALSAALPFTRIRLLDISNNRLNDEGLTILIYTIKKSTQMRYLYLWGNDFGQRTNRVTTYRYLQRMLRSGVLVQEHIDVKIYTVDGLLYAAFYPADRYKHRYYEVMDYGCPVELKIKRNRIEKEGEKPRALLNFQHIDRIPPLLNKKT